MATILVIDDEEMIRMLSEKILQRDSHNVLLAESGSQAITIFQEQHNNIEIVIVDMLLDDMNGFEILDKIREINPEISGIISSGNPYNDDDIPEKIKNNIHFLQKPYRAQVLSDLVSSLLIQT